MQSPVSSRTVLKSLFGTTDRYLGYARGRADWHSTGFETRVQSIIVGVDANPALVQTECDIGLWIFIHGHTEGTQ